MHPLQAASNYSGDQKMPCSYENQVTSNNHETQQMNPILIQLRPVPRVKSRSSEA